MQASAWSVATDRALSLEETGGCWVELSRIVVHDDIGAITELDCAFYGPVEAWA